MLNKERNTSPKIPILSQQTGVTQTQAIRVAADQKLKEGFLIKPTTIQNPLAIQNSGVQNQEESKTKDQNNTNKRFSVCYIVA